MSGLAWLWFALTLQDPVPPRFAAEAVRVRLDVFVGHGDEPVPGLTADDFEVRDDGERQRIRLVMEEQAPLHAILVLDTSASVAGKRLAELKAAVLTFLAQLGRQDRVSLLTFSHELKLHGEVAGSAAGLAARVDEVDAQGSTSLNDAVAAGLLLADPRLGRSAVLLFSDGLDRLSWFSDAQVTELARHAEAVVYGLSPGEESVTALMQALARQTGGRVWESRSTDWLRERFLRILHEFRSRYLLEFEPSSARPGWHRLDVRLRGRKGEIRARPGYHYSPWYPAE